MGVKHLWSIIQPVGKKEPLESLRGKTLCVDLSTWICQAEETLPLKRAVLKPYLRNTIFRVLCLKRLGTRLIFLTEGTPPELKWNVILARASARTDDLKGRNGLPCSKKTGRGKNYQNKNGSNANEKSTSAKPKKVGRSVFQRKINECTQLLRYLGIPVIKSKGEAEACCALLDRRKLADGCITQDGDTFLYGANVVYRNLGISNKDPHVYRYSMDDVQRQIGIDRQQMIALSLLFGCDYCDGVQGIGVKSALKLLNQQRGIDVLQTFRDWKRDRRLSDASSSIEKLIFKKLVQVDGFPNEEVIKEFLLPKDDYEAIKGQISWDYPDLVNIQRFCFKHMEWPEEYTLSKVLGVAANEHLNRISRGIPVSCPFTPNRLLKSRTLHGVPLCEVEWRMKSNEKRPESWKGYPETFITLESQQEILQCLPDLVNEFEMLKLQKKSKGKKNRKKADEETHDIEDRNDDIDVLDINKNGLNYYKESDNVITNVAENYRMDHCKNDENFMEDSLNNKAEKSSVKHEHGFAAVDSNSETSEDPYSVDDIVQSFIEIDLSSFCAEDTDSMAVENNKCAIDIDQEDETLSVVSDEASEILPLRERIGRKLLNNRKESHKEEGQDKRTGCQILIEGTSLREEIHFEREIIEHNIVTEESGLEEYVEGASQGKKGIECSYEDEELVPTEETERASFRPDEQGDVQNSEPDPSPRQGATATGGSQNANTLIPNENDSNGIEAVDISSDSLAHIMMENSFDSPHSNEERENFEYHESTPNNEKYINNLRKRVGIRQNLTPENLDASDGDLPEITEGEEKSTIASLPLMERLKRRLQKK